MVRRVGFGNTPKPEKPRKPRVPVPEDIHETRPTPELPNPAPMPDQEAPTKGGRSGGTLPVYKVAKIIIAILLAIRIESTIVSVILILWVSIEIWSILRNINNTAGREE
ncbi:MAG: hypothetical protein COA53_01160 [Rhodobacteraceae bacterium]|nr:MAG: hypothetical protein COA53_01160 [Paracoccaceae bacterium]